jgi:hypothetical protein
MYIDPPIFFFSKTFYFNRVAYPKIELVCANEAILVIVPALWHKIRSN